MALATVAFTAIHPIANVGTCAGRCSCGRGRRAGLVGLQQFSVTGRKASAHQHGGNLSVVHGRRARGVSAIRITTNTVAQRACGRRCQACGQRGGWKQRGCVSTASTGQRRPEGRVGVESQGEIFGVSGQHFHAASDHRCGFTSRRLGGGGSRRLATAGRSCVVVVAAAGAETDDAGGGLVGLFPISLVGLEGDGPIADYLSGASIVGRGVVRDYQGWAAGLAFFFGLVQADFVAPRIGANLRAGLRQELQRRFATLLLKLKLLVKGRMYTFGGQLTAEGKGAKYSGVMYRSATFEIMLLRI